MQKQLSFLRNLGKNSFIVTDSNIYGLYKSYLPADVFVLPAGESAKTLQSVQVITAAMLKKNITRGGVLVAIGGGMIGDLVGFVASIYMRGIDWICIPTTITALADSSVGGKTAVNAGGKNTLGTFWLPKEVHRCYEFLDTLPRGEIANGMVEVFKTALLDESLFDMINAKFGMVSAEKAESTEIFWGEQTAPIARIGEGLKDILERCASVKQSIVSRDFLDKGERKKLNLGHTVGHALEYALKLSHGTSVAIGLCAESFMCGVTPSEIILWLNQITKPYLDKLEKQKLDESSLASLLTDIAQNDKKNSGKISVIALKNIGETEEVFFDTEAFRKKLWEFFAQHSKKSTEIEANY